MSGVSQPTRTGMSTPGAPACATQFEAASCDQLLDKVARWVAQQRRQQREAAEAALAPAERASVLQRRRRALESRAAGLARAGRQPQAAGMIRTAQGIAEELQTLQQMYPQIALASASGPYGIGSPLSSPVGTTGGAPSGPFSLRPTPVQSRQTQETDDERQASLQRMYTEIEQLERALNESQANERQLQEVQRSMLSEVEALRDALVAASSEAETLRGTHATVTGQQARTDTALIAAQRQVADLTVALESATAQARQLGSALRAQQARTTALQAEVDALQNEVDGLQGRIDQATSEYTSLSAYTDRLLTAIRAASDAAAENARLQQENETLTRANDQLRTERDRLRQYGADRQAANVDLGMALNAANGLIMQQHRESEAMRAQLDTDLADREAVATDLLQAVSRRTNGAANLSRIEQLLDQERTITNLRATIDGLRGQLQQDMDERIALDRTLRTMRLNGPLVPRPTMASTSSPRRPS